jgi:hypothetical protein
MNEIAVSPPVSVDPHDAPSLGRQMLNKVPEITLYFWIIKIPARRWGRPRPTS